MLCDENNATVMEMFKHASVYFVRGAVRRCAAASESVCVCVCVCVCVRAQMSTSAANSHSALLWQILHLSEYSKSSVPALCKNTYM